MAQGIVLCDICVEEEEEGKWFCKNCHQSLCDKCNIRHLRSTVTKYHDIVPRNQMFDTQGENAKPADEACKIHKSELLILFCQLCHQFICRRCLTSEHMKHNVIEIENVFHEQQNKAKYLLHELMKMKQGSKQSIEKEELLSELSKQITREVDQMVSEVLVAKELLIKEANRLCEEYEENRSNSESESQALDARVQDSICKLNQSMLSNKVSSLSEVTKLCSDEIENYPSPRINTYQIHFRPGNHNMDQMTRMIGRLEMTKESNWSPNYFINYAVLEKETLTLQYDFPATKRVLKTEPVAQLIGLEPFSKDIKKMSICIVDEGKYRYIAIGMVPREYKKYRLPGWEPDSYGYHADDGGVFTGNSERCESREACYKGDVMEIGFNIETRKLSFSRNGKQVYETTVNCDSHFYPMVALESPGEQVQLLEKEVWFMHT